LQEIPWPNFARRRKLLFYVDDDGAGDFIQRHNKLFPAPLGIAKMLILLTRAQFCEELGSGYAFVNLDR
jgi:hypothetical protein